MYKLKSKNGKVGALLRSGKDYARNTIPVAAAQHIIDTGTVVRSEVPEYPICVDKLWYFEGEKVVKQYGKGGK